MKRGESGKRARMVDVGGKAITRREARAWGQICMSLRALKALREGRLPKGDALAAARLAGIMAAKKTWEIIPLCHPLELDAVDVDLKVKGRGVEVVSRVRSHGRTGVEMEALTAVMAALLTIYDMVKGIERGAVIGPARLLAKSGGRSGPHRGRRVNR